MLGNTVAQSTHHGRGPFSSVRFGKTEFEHGSHIAAFGRFQCPNLVLGREGSDHVGNLRNSSNDLAKDLRLVLI